MSEPNNELEESVYESDTNNNPDVTYKQNDALGENETLDQQDQLNEQEETAEVINQNNEQNEVEIQSTPIVLNQTGPSIIPPNIKLTQDNDLMEVYQLIEIQFTRHLVLWVFCSVLDRVSVLEVMEKKVQTVALNLEV
jgi:hypothetical protein